MKEIMDWTDKLKEAKARLSLVQRSAYSELDFDSDDIAGLALTIGDANDLIQKVIDHMDATRTKAA
ncbi:MAG: hypothetical protein CXR31_09715 [Geobacter sp.]|nr:MAG: hypothetical protein CXR31_09715 [Geobacter sp.]